MKAYGRAAVAAAKLSGLRKAHSPIEAWRKSIAVEFPESKSMREKSGPRGAFLGLCEDERVIGVQAGRYTRSKLNKKYAVAAVRLLRLEPSLISDRAQLWLKVVGQSARAHNGQLDVVFGLWDAGLIVS